MGREGVRRGFWRSGLGECKGLQLLRFRVESSWIAIRIIRLLRSEVEASIVSVLVACTVQSHGP